MFLASCLIISLLHTGQGYHLIDDDSNTVPSNVTNISNIYIAFVTQWRPEACYNSQAPNCLNSSITSNITIHGEWPDYYNSSSYPQYCTQEELEESEISSIESQLELLWPTYSSSWTDLKFWSHEWSKHGTCWFTKTPSTFFQQGLTFYYKYDVQKALTNGGIVAGKTYAHTEVDNALQTAFGLRCVIGCEDQKYIASFQICVDWNGNGVDCPTHLNTNCGSEVMLSTGDRE